MDEVKEPTLTELKAIAYDLIAQREQADAMLREVNSRIFQAQQAAKEAKEPEGD